MWWWTSTCDSGADLPSRPNGHWMPWLSANCPATARGEQQFLADLRLLSAAETWSPHHVGGTDDQPAPGLRPVRLLRSYLDLDVRRQKAVHAWDWIVADPSENSLYEWGPDAAALMSPIVGQLLDVARRMANRYESTVVTAAMHIEETGRCVAEVERALDAEPYGSKQAVELGRVLYDPAGSALTNQPTHLPARVGTLTPSRVATLLGDRLEVTFPLAG